MQEVELPNDAVQWSVYAHGIIRGYDDRIFGPDDPVTREQMAVMLVKALELQPVPSDAAFMDDEGISSWALSYVIGTVIDGVTCEGSNVISAIRFGIADTEKYDNEALKLAVKNAAEKANSIARVLDHANAGQNTNANGPVSSEPCGI